jgi:hypothetical protein
MRPGKGRRAPATRQDTGGGEDTRRLALQGDQAMQRELQVQPMLHPIDLLYGPLIIPLASCNPLL